MLTSTFELGHEDSGCVEMADRNGFLEIEKTSSLSLAGNSSSNLALKLHCAGEYSLAGTVTCTRCSDTVQNILPGDCKNFKEQSLVKYSKSAITIPEYILLEKEEEQQVMVTLLAIVLSGALVGVILTAAAIWWCLSKSKEGGERR